MALFDTKKNGVASAKSWALALTDDEDRDMHCSGSPRICSLGVNDVKLPYDTYFVI
jgi:hypothetical protein